ncbi:sulfatase, partial [bacterium]|nr:sulfatase [bacterium]
MKRLWLILVLVLAVGAVAALGWLGLYRKTVLPAAAAGRPSVILISLDTVRPDALGCGGSRRPTSPNLDRFAAQAAWFSEARAQAPWTLPSHMSLFTSLLPSRNGVEDIGQRLADHIPTLPELLQRAGYQTAAFVNNGQMKPHWGFARGFDLWQEYEVDEPEGGAPHITDEALRWLADNPRQPFFLFLHYFDAHDPYDPPPAYRQQFAVTLGTDAIHAAIWQHRFPGQDCPDPALMDQVRAAYDAEIAALDAELGRL